MAKMESESTQMKKRIREETEFGRKLIDTIPLNVYFNYETNLVVTAEKHRIAEQRLLELKRPHKKLSNKTKHKRAKLDPQQHRTVSQIQQQMRADWRAENRKGNKVTGNEVAETADCQAVDVSMEEPSVRLKAKIKKFEGKRKKYPSAVDQLEQKRLKRRLSKFKVKERKKTQKQIEMYSTGDSPGIEAEAKVVEVTANGNKSLLFSKLDFSEIEDADKKTKKKKKKMELAGKDHKSLLSKVQKKKAKIEAIKAKDPEKAKAMVDTIAWQKALQKAGGTKIKDDEKLLNKSLKKKEKIKMKKKKKWESRVEQVEHKKDERQKKRQENIKKRKQEKVKKKIKRMVKKGRIIPGFS